MKKQIPRKKIALTSETVRQLSDSLLGDAVGGASVPSKQAYGVVSCPNGTLHCNTGGEWVQ